MNIKDLIKKYTQLIKDNHAKEKRDSNDVIEVIRYESFIIDLQELEYDLIMMEEERKFYDS